MIGLPKFGPEPRFELRTSEPNLRFKFSSSSGSDLWRKFGFRFSKILVGSNPFELTDHLLLSITNYDMVYSQIYKYKIVKHVTVAITS